MWAGSCRKKEQTNFIPLCKIWKVVAESPDPYASAVRILEVLGENIAGPSGLAGPGTGIL